MAIMHELQTDIFIERIFSDVDGADDIVTQVGYKSRNTAATPYGGASNIQVTTGCVDKDGNAIACEAYLFSFQYNTEPPGLSGETEGLRITFTDSVDENGDADGNVIVPFQRIYMFNGTGLGGNPSTNDNVLGYSLEPNASNEYVLVAEYENREVADWLMDNINNTPHVLLKCYTEL